MGRSHSLVGEVLAVVAKLTVPVACTAAVGAWLLFHWLANLPLPVAPRPSDLSRLALTQAARTAGAIFQYVVPVLLVAGAAVAAMRRGLQGRLYDTLAEHRTALSDIDWRAFEGLVGEHFRRLGFTVEERGGSGPDGGVDLLLRRDSDRYVVQCKHWRSRQVGVATVREIYGAMAALGALGAYVVTSGTFTRGAKEFAAGRHIELVDATSLRPRHRDSPARSLAALQPGTRQGHPRTGLFSEQTLSALDVHGECRSEPELRSLTCDRCGAPMTRRVARYGSHAGEEFFGCTRFPACRNVHPASRHSSESESPTDQ